MWAAFTLACFGFLWASEVTYNSSSFASTVHLCLRVITLSLTLNPPPFCSLPSRNLKPTPFARLYLNHSKVHQLYLLCDGYERLPLQCKSAAAVRPCVYLHQLQWQVELPCLPDYGALFWTAQSLPTCWPLFHTQFSVLVQLLPQPWQVCLHGLSRFWAPEAQTVMNVTPEPLKTLFAIPKQLVMINSNVAI